MTLDAMCKVRNPFAGRDAEADEERRPQSAVNPLVERLLHIYAAKVASYPHSMVIGGAHDHVASVLRRVPTPSPAEIDAVSQRLGEGEWQGLYLTLLMEKAAKRGFTEFFFRPNGAISGLPEAFQPVRRTSVHINGDGGSCCYSNKNCDIHIHGNAAQGLGGVSEDCTFTVEGDVAGALGNVAKACQFVVKGDVADFWLPEHGCTYDLFGRVGQLQRDYSRTKEKIAELQFTIRVQEGLVKPMRAYIRQMGYAGSRVEALP